MNKPAPNHQLTQNFSIREFMCKDGTHVPEHLLSNVRQLATNLQVLRSYLAVPIIINSGYRTPAYNKKVGGAFGSQHLLANAADIHTKEYSPFYIYNKLRELMKSGKIEAGCIILYNTFVHYDRRGTMLFLDHRNKSKS